METKEVVAASAIVLLAFVAGYALGDWRFSPQLPEGYSSDFNFEMNSSNDTRTFNFDNRSVSFLYSDGGEMRAFLDVNNDGSADRLINTSVRDGEEHATQEIVTRRGKSYRIFIRYMDGPEEQDGYFRVYSVEEIV